MKVQKITQFPKIFNDLRDRVGTLEGDKKQLEKIVEEQGKLLEGALHAANKAVQRAAEAEHFLRSLKSSNKTQKSSSSKSAVSSLFADSHENDMLYIELENEFRGSEKEIAEKQKRHLNIYRDSKVDFNKHPALDIGSGRGEFITLLGKEGIPAIGIDLNEQMVERMKQKGLNAVNANAVTYLSEQPSDSIGAISGFHIAEHVPFDVLIALVAEAQRVLVPGGHLLLETPNPENLNVGAFTFHYDPSHLKPIPPAIMLFLAKYKGFSKADILRFAPEIEEKTIEKEVKDKLLQDALKKLYGPRDYALLAFK